MSKNPIASLRAFTREERRIVRTASIPMVSEPREFSRVRTTPHAQAQVLAGALRTAPRDQRPFRLLTEKIAPFKRVRGKIKEPTLFLPSIDLQLPFDSVQSIKEIQSTGFALVAYASLHFRPDDELRYKVGRNGKATAGELSAPLQPGLTACESVLLDFFPIFPVAENAWRKVQSASPNALNRIARRR